MKTKRFFFLFFLFIIFSSCSPKPKKLLIEQQVINYVKNNCKIESKSNQIIFFITGYSNGCRPCEEGTRALVDSIIRLKSLSVFSKFAVLFENTVDFYKFILPDTSFTIISDSRYNLQKQGIDLSLNFIVEFDANFKLIYWEYLVPENFNKIYKHYKNDDRIQN